MIAGIYLDLARAWAAGGVPDDRSTVAYVSVVLNKLLEDRDAMIHVIESLTDEDGPGLTPAATR